MHFIKNQNADDRYGLNRNGYGYNRDPMKK